MGIRSRKLVYNIVIGVILLLVIVITLYPVIWMVSGSLKSQQEFYTNIWGIPQSWLFQNYINAWETGKLGSRYLNTILITAVFLAISLPVNCCAAYALGRLSFKGRGIIYTILLMGIMMPGGVLAIPTFTVALHFGLVNSMVGLSVIYCASSVSFGIFIMRSFFISLPKSLEEAALIDGCTPFKSFRKIILPLSVPGIMTQVIFNGLNTWNEYFMASIFLRDEKKYTLSIGIATMQNASRIIYPELFAALCWVTLPMIVVYLICQKSFIEGIAAGAVKG